MTLFNTIYLLISKAQNKTFPCYLTGRILMIKIGVLGPLSGPRMFHCKKRSNSMHNKISSHMCQIKRWFPNAEKYVNTITFTSRQMGFFFILLSNITQRHEKTVLKKDLNRDLSYKVKYWNLMSLWYNMSYIICFIYTVLGDNVSKIHLFVAQSTIPGQYKLATVNIL